MRKVNYHTHTYRCHHALGNEEEYVQKAIEGGFEELGFADHTPWYYANGYVSGMRMKSEQLDGYIESLKALRQRYAKDISIKIGLECEYCEEKMLWLKKLLESKAIDYIILGNHFHGSDEYGIYYGRLTDSVETLRNYVEDVKKACDTGLYSYLAHPDLIHYKDTKDRHYQQAMTELCLYTKKAHLPLEFNLLGFKEHRHYPCDDFWKIAAKCQCQVIIGIDAHEPSRLADQKTYIKAQKYLADLGIEIIDEIRFLK